MRFIGAVHVGVDRIRHEPRQALGCSWPRSSTRSRSSLAVCCAIHALGVSVPNAAVLAFVPAVASAQVMPISLSGLGIREGLLVLLLHPLGVPTGKAIGVGLLWYGMMLVVSLLGAPAFAVGHRHEHEQTSVVVDDRRHSHGRVGDGQTRVMSVVEEDASAPDEPSPPTVVVPLHRRLPGGRTCATVTASTGGSS